MSVAQSGSVLLTNVRPWGGMSADIAIESGAIVSVDPHDPARAATASDGDEARSPEAGSRAAGGRETIDGRGLLALPGLVNAHAHLDKSWWGREWVPYGGEATTQGRIAHERAHRDELGIPSPDSTLQLLRALVAQGTTAFRSHVDVDLGVGLRGIAVVREAVAALGIPVALEVVAFPQDGVLRRPGMLELLDRAAAEGADHVGGLDPALIDRDPVGQLDALFEIADRRGVGLDIHLHEGGDLGAFEYELIIERTQALDLAGRVNVAHGFAIGDLAPARQRALVDQLREAGVSITTVAPITVSRLPLADLRAAGVPVGLGTDGIRDLWGPYGDGDMLRLATRLAQLSGARRDKELTDVVRLATSDSGVFVGRAVHDLVAGAPADVVLVDAQNVPEALVLAPPRELVLVGGIRVD